MFYENIENKPETKEFCSALALRAKFISTDSKNLVTDSIKINIHADNKNIVLVKPPNILDLFHPNVVLSVFFKVDKYSQYIEMVIAKISANM